jgi:hypothetical protein
VPGAALERKNAAREDRWLELLQLNTLFVLESRLVERTPVEDVVEKTSD